MHFSTRSTRPAAALAATGFLLFAGFQIALALGAPWGAAAWGGSHDTLPVTLRIGSAASAVVFIVSALVLLGRADYWGASVPYGVFRWGTRILVVAMTLSAVANVASSSDWERFLMGPIAVILALLCLLVTRSNRATDASQRGGH